VTGGRACHACARGTAFMLGAGASESLFDARLDIAFGLATDGRQFRDDKVTLAERERFEMTQVCQVLEHIGDLENVARAHLFRKVFEAVFPIVGGGREIICEVLEEQFTLAGTDRGAKANFYGVGDWNENQRIGSSKTKRVEGKGGLTYLLLLYLLDGSDPVIRINNFLADFKAHHSTSIELQKSACAARAGLKGCPSGCGRRSKRRVRLNLTKV
jgi:hypothetical protein